MLEVPASTTQMLLGVNTRLRNKLINQGVLVFSSEVENPRGNGYIKYFTYSSILDCLNNPKFQAEYENYQKHHEADQLRAQKAVATRVGKTREKMENYKVIVNRVSPVKLYQRALNAKVQYHKQRAIWSNDDYDYCTYEDLDSAPEEDRNRWVDNYIRHHLTNYDSLNNVLKGQVGKNKLFIEEWRKRVEDKIKKTYPFYKESSYIKKYHSDGKK